MLFSMPDRRAIKQFELLFSEVIVDNELDIHVCSSLKFHDGSSNGAVIKNLIPDDFTIIHHPRFGNRGGEMLLFTGIFGCFSVADNTHHRH